MHTKHTSSILLEDKQLNRIRYTIYICKKRYSKLGQGQVLIRSSHEKRPTITWPNPQIWLLSNLISFNGVGLNYPYTFQL